MTEPDTPAHGERATTTTRIPLYRRILYAAVVLLLVEACAWVGDLAFGYRDVVLDTLRYAEFSTAPRVADPALLEAGDAIFVRSTTDNEAAVPHVIGGVAVPDGRNYGRQDLVTQRDIVRAGRRRLFVVGGSAAFGSLFRYRDTFAGRLAASPPWPDLDVYDAAIPGFATADVVPVVERIAARYDPAFVVIFAGNNEWFHWMPSAQPRVDPSKLHLARALATSRVLALAEYLVVRDAVAQQDEFRHAVPGYAIHHELTGYAYALEHPYEEFAPFDRGEWTRTKGVYLDSFAQNLEAMIDLCAARGARAVLCTVPVNPRLSPAWKHPQPLASHPALRAAVEAHLRAAAAALDSGDAEGALDEADAALAVDDYPPLAHYLRGAALEALSRFSEAEDAYARCRENMIGNLGSTTSVNDTIRRVAAERGVPLADLENALREAGLRTGRPLKRGLMADDCHATPAGHREIEAELRRVLKGL